MLAEDMRPNRLEQAKRAIADLVGKLGGDRVGLVAFAGEGVTVCPLTLDHATVLLLFMRESSRIAISRDGIARGWASTNGWETLGDITPPSRLSLMWKVSTDDRKVAVWASIARDPDFREALDRWAPPDSPARRMLDGTANRKE